MFVTARSGISNLTFNCHLVVTWWRWPVHLILALQYAVWYPSLNTKVIPSIINAVENSLKAWFLLFPNSCSISLMVRRGCFLRFILVFSATTVKKVQIVYFGIAYIKPKRKWRETSPHLFWRDGGNIEPLICSLICWPVLTSMDVPIYSFITFFLLPLFSVQSLPAYSRNSITCASWRSPMIAFGMSDGCVAVRNLLTKETLVRYMAVLVSDSNFGVTPSPAVPDLVAFSSVVKGELLSANGEINSPSYVKKVEFMFAGGSACRLLTLCHGGVAIWEPKQVAD